MSLFRKSGSPFWYYTFYFQGKRYRKSTEKTTKSAAATVEAEALSALNSGTPVVDKTMKPPTLREFSVDFLDWVENNIQFEPNTKKFYRYGWRLLSFTTLPSMRIDQITTEIISCTKFNRPVINRSTRQPTGEIVPVSKTYVNQALRTLKVIFGFAVNKKVVTATPKIRTVRANRRQRMVDPESETQLERAFNVPIKHRHIRHLRQQAWLFFVILQDTGTRPDEVYPMKIEDIHWNERNIWIPSGKTENSPRFVGMSDRVFEMLRAWCGGKARGYVFPARREKSKCPHLQSINVGFRAARERANVDSRIVPYSARHTFGTFTYAATGNIFAVSRSMGHGSIKSMDDYQHPDTSILAAAINRRNNHRKLESGHTFGHTTNSNY